MPQDAIKIAKALAANITVEKLVIDDNYIEDEGLQALIHLLRTNRRITSLSMSNNCRYAVSDETIYSLCSFLREPDCQLTELDFTQNTNLTQLKLLFEAIQANNSLKEVNLNFKRAGILGSIMQTIIKEHIEGLSTTESVCDSELSIYDNSNFSEHSRSDSTNSVFFTPFEQDGEEKLEISIEPDSSVGNKMSA
jgi:hypothetical protein